MGIAVGLEKLLYLLLISFGKWAELFFTIIYMSNIILMFFNWHSLYRKNLEKTGMNGLSGILLRDSVGQVLEVTGVCEGEIRTVSVEAGYRCRHRIEAVFQLPLIFRSMIWLWWGRGCFSLLLSGVWYGYGKRFV